MQKQSLRTFQIIVLGILISSSASAQEGALSNSILSTVQLTAFEAGTNTVVARASGVIVSPTGWVVTNEHAVFSPGRNFWDIEVRPTGTNEIPDIRCSYRVPAGNVALSSLDDVALLIPDPDTVPCQPLSYMKPLNSFPRTVTPIQALGYPATNIGSGSLTVTAGQVAGRVENTDGRLLFLKADVLIGPGNSGGPVIDDRGRFIGLSTAISEIELSDGVIQKFVGLVVPSYNILEAFPEIPSQEDEAIVEIMLPADTAVDVWYSFPLADFVDAGYIASNTRFRPSEKALRSEYISLIIDLLGGATVTRVDGQSFDDVDIDREDYWVFEEAAKRGLVRGQGACLGTHPCYANPDSPINRAEAATLLLRAFALIRKEIFPDFRDSVAGQWYTDGINAASSLCILRGDDARRTVRPGDHMNRAEMIVMLYRVFEDLSYPHCTDAGKVVRLPLSPLHKEMDEMKDESTDVFSGNLPCTFNAWNCIDIGPCQPNREQLRKCTLRNAECRNPERVKPPDIHSCVPAQSRLEEMKSIIDHGRALETAMDDEALRLIRTYADIVINIRERYNEKLDAYLNYYNSALRDSRWLKLYGDDINLIEKELEALEVQFNQVERVYYR